MVRERDAMLVHAFRHSTPYVNHHRGSTFVIMLSGETVADAPHGRDERMTHIFSPENKIVFRHLWVDPPGVVESHICQGSKRFKLRHGGKPARYP